ncbi:retrovirus-related Pol polyprotein from transposon 17.6 [Trichonephila clavipes]|uniref:Retrovirus-related Pol polyprotein from transposon 17.6 n=1 Tax=Trichonephila clavipes TaxID=2585209 RepID=A0A8X6RSA7_TRICX|nr:retrovirus-related Pol polyprotein from transposon 17.6 [Trichonephila clavipes]
MFSDWGEPTPFVKHFINTGDHPPVSTAPYRLSPNRKEHLRKEIDNLLAHNIIKECESPYAAPVVLVPKSNATVRLCIDYRKLNAITIPDKYPLPLMDILLHDAKSNAFISALDLKIRLSSGRGQSSGPGQDCIRFLPF